MANNDDRRVLMSRRAQLLCVWCGPVMLLSLGIGVAVLAGFVPAPDPTATAQQISHQYVHNLGGIRAGLCLFMAGIALLGPWGAAVAAQTQRSNLGTPALTITQVVCVAVSLMIGLLSCIAWGAASFRAGHVSPETTRTFNDLGWILFIFDWSPLAVWYLAVGLAIFTDPGDEPILPRWAGYLSIWTAALSVPGGVTILFKTGPFAFNGLLAFWVPLIVFSIWIVVLTVLVIEAINREAQAAIQRQPAISATKAAPAARAEAG
jgi:hypothetical protein